MKLTREEKIALLNKKAKPVDPNAKWLQIAKWNKEHADALEDYMIIAMRILSTLKERKMTQKELAKQLGVTPQALTRIMKGRQNLSLNKVRQIERVLGISIMNIKKKEKNLIKEKTKIIPIKVQPYKYSMPIFEVAVDLLKASSKKEQKKSINEQSMAS